MYNNYYTATFYNYNLEQEGGQINIAQYSGNSDGLGHFFKAYYLYDWYVAFIYFENIRYFVLKILLINNDLSTFSSRNTYSGNEFSLTYYPKMNEFLKIDNNRFVLLSANVDTYSSILYIIFFDFYDTYLYKKVRYYYHTFNTDKISKFSDEISGFIYNDFLL